MTKRTYQTPQESEETNLENLSEDELAKIFKESDNEDDRETVFKIFRENTKKRMNR